LRLYNYDYIIFWAGVKVRIIFCGMDGAFSYLPLAAILKAMKTGQNAGLEVAGVILPASAAPNFLFDGSVSWLPSERPQSEVMRFCGGALGTGLGPWLQWRGLVQRCSWYLPFGLQGLAG
jgi:hypothetical protein